VAAVGDLHCRDDHQGRFRQLIKQVNAEADVLLLCGDLTDRGMLEEGKVLAEALSGLRSAPSWRRSTSTASTAITTSSRRCSGSPG
jgi:hypothetical protein